MIEYTVRVYAGGSKFWYLNDEYHREDGPAIEDSDGSKEWWLNGVEVSEEEHKRRTSKATCAGKVVKIDGIEYELREL